MDGGEPTQQGAPLAHVYPRGPVRAFRCVLGRVDGMEGRMTLLEQAKAIKSKRRPVNAEELDLYIAMLNSEIAFGQGFAALGKSKTYTSGAYRLAITIRAAIAAGHLKRIERSA